MKPKIFFAKCLRRGMLPFLPTRRRLPFNLWIHLRFDKPEAELVHLDSLANHRGVAIDAGANMGLFTLRLSRIFKKVFAFEINEEASRDLKDCGLPNVEVFDVGLSNRVDRAKLYIPVLKQGLQLNGWASLERGNCPDASRHIEKNVVVKPLDDFQINDCSFLKIDVEGHELPLLEGAVKTIERGRPVILIEIRERNELEVFRFLESLGYRRLYLEQIVGVPGSQGNFIFSPAPAPL